MPEVKTYSEQELASLLAAAYEAAALACDRWTTEDSDRHTPHDALGAVAFVIRDLTPLDARQALDELMTAAREAGRMEVRRQMGGFQGTEIGAIDVIVARQRAKAMKVGRAVGTAEERKRCARIADQQCRACSTAASIRASSVGSRAEPSPALAAYLALEGGVRERTDEEASVLDEIFAMLTDDEVATLNARQLDPAAP